LFAKYQWLEERIGRGLPIPISKERQQVYARRLRRRRSAHIAELPPFRQELETMCFAAVCLGTLADDMLRLLEIRITSVWTWGPQGCLRSVDSGPGPQEIGDIGGTAAPSDGQDTHR
jgi:hypothetical protein